MSERVDGDVLPAVLTTMVVGGKSADGKTRALNVDATGNLVSSAGSVPAPGVIRLEDGASTQLASVTQQHLGDGLTPISTGGVLLAAGPTQVTDLIGANSRLREAGADQQPALGIQSGIASFMQEFVAACTTSVAAGAAPLNATSVATSFGITLTVSSSVNMKVGAKLNFEPGTANYESAYVKAIPSSTTVTVVFGSAGALFTHTQPYNVQYFLANQERDFSGEGPQATGTGAAIASEFESNSGGYPLASGLPSGLTLDADRNWQGKGPVSLAVTATGAGNTTLVFSGNPWVSGLILASPILLSVGAAGAIVEEVTVSKDNIPVVGAGPVTVKLVNPVVNAGSTFATYDAFALDGPGNGGATPLGLEDSAIYIRDPAPADPKKPFFAWRGSAGAGQVQGTTSSGSVATGNAVLIGVADAAGGAMRPLSSGQGDATNPVFTLAAMGYAATNTVSADRLRTPTTFKTVSATAAGSTAVWTPTAGKKFRLMKLLVTVTGNAAAAAGTIEEMTLLDAAAAVGLRFSCFVPAAAGTTFSAGYTTGWVDLGNGYLSTTVNNALNISLGTALTAGEVTVTAIGTEE